MSGTVIDIRTKLPQKQAQSTADQIGTVYECARCGARDQLFKLFTDGHVSCGDCGARMNNLQVNYTGDKNGPKLRA